MKILKSVLEESLAKIGGFKDKEHSTVSFIVEKGVLTLLVRNDVDYAMRRLVDIEGIEEVDSFAIEVSELMYVLGFSDSDAVNFKFVDNKVHIQSGIISLKANRGEVSKVSKVSSDNMVKYTVDADRFVQSISMASNAIEVDTSFKGCVSVDVVDKKAKVQALDGTVGIFDYFDIEADKNFTLNIPKEKIQLYKGMTGQYKGVYDIDNQVLFAANDEYIFSIKLKDYKFSDFRTQLGYGNSLMDIVKQSDVVLDISREELSRCVSLFKSMKGAVYAEFRKKDNKYTLTCATDEKSVTVELMGKAIIKRDAELFYFDIGKIKWIQHLKEDKVFVFFKRYVSGMAPAINKVVPYSQAEGQFDDISQRKVGLFLPAKDSKVDSFYKELEGDDKKPGEVAESVTEEESEEDDVNEEVQA